MNQQRDPTDLRGAEQDRQEDEKAEALVREKEVKDFCALMATAHGRRIVNGLLARCGLFRSSFTSNRSLTDFNEGQRNVGLYYMGLINEHCLDEYVLMLQEHNGP